MESHSLYLLMQPLRCLMLCILLRNSTNTPMKHGIPEKLDSCCIVWHLYSGRLDSECLDYVRLDPGRLDSGYLKSGCFESVRLDSEHLYFRCLGSGLLNSGGFDFLALGF